MRAYLFIVLVAAAVTYLTTPAARRLARRIGAVTPVRDRDVHTVPIPRLGGTAIFLGVAIAILTASQVPFFHTVFQDQGRATHVVLLSAGAVCLLGVFDDLWQLDAITKLAGQALASGVMAWQGIQLVSLPIFGTFIPSRGFLIVITVIAIVVTINAVNFVDGLDGLAAGMVAIAGSAFFIYSYLLTRSANSNDYSSLASLIIAALVGACLGFLPHNFNPARIFMGDSGSMLIGLLLATSTVAITGRVQPHVLAQAKIVPAFLPLVLPLAVLALPLIDLALAVIRRTKAGKMPWQPDKMHLHHRMLAIGHSHAGAVLILYFWTATVAFGAAMFALMPPHRALLVGGVALLAALMLTIGPRRLHRGRRAHGTPITVVSTAATSTLTAAPTVMAPAPTVTAAATTARPTAPTAMAAASTAMATAPTASVPTPSGTAPIAPGAAPIAPGADSGTPNEAGPQSDSGDTSLGGGSGFSPPTIPNGVALKKISSEPGVNSPVRRR